MRLKCVAENLWFGGGGTGFWRIHLYTRTGSVTGSFGLTLFHLLRSSIAAPKLR